MDVKFLCGKFLNENYIYAIKSKEGCEWRYFKEIDSSIEEQTAFVKDKLNDRINNLESGVLKSFDLRLDSEHVISYYRDGKYMYKGDELLTCMQLTTSNPTSREKPPRNRITTDDLIFIHGQTNPAFFLERFEKAIDVKTDSDKPFKIRQLVDEEQKASFSSMYLVGDWQKARETFLKSYSRLYICNKKRALSIRFEDQSTLREFVHKKIQAMSKFTELQNIKDQMDIILTEFPNEISVLFVVKDKLNRSIDQILEFCEMIQDQAQQFQDESSASIEPDYQSSTSNQAENEMQNIQEPMEIFDLNSQTSTSSSARSKKTSTRGIRKTNSRGRGSKTLQSPIRRSSRLDKSLSAIQEEDVLDYESSSLTSFSFLKNCSPMNFNDSSDSENI